MEDELEDLANEIGWYMAWYAEQARRERIERNAKSWVERWLLENLHLGNIDAKSKGHIMFLGEYEYFFALRNGHHVLREIRLAPIEKNGQRSMAQYELFEIPFCLDVDLLDLNSSSCPSELVHYVLTHPQEVYQAMLEVDTISSYFPAMLAKAARSIRHPELEEFEELDW